MNELHISMLLWPWKGPCVLADKLPSLGVRNRRKSGSHGQERRVVRPGSCAFGICSRGHGNNPGQRHGD